LLNVWTTYQHLLNIDVFC